MKSKKLSKLLKIQAVVFAVIIAVGVCSVGVFAYNCSRVRSDVLRMHVIANSDSDGDQALKLKVRDAVLERGAELFDGTVTADEAKAKIEPQKAELEAAAREVIEREGYDYPVSVNVVNEYFATRCYGSLTMPAGRYTAVKVVIGEGAGHNWWCVMYPALCFTDMTGGVLGPESEDQLHGVLSDDTYNSMKPVKFRFRFLTFLNRFLEN